MVVVGLVILGKQWRWRRDVRQRDSMKRAKRMREPTNIPITTPSLSLKIEVGFDNFVSSIEVDFECVFILYASSLMPQQAQSPVTAQNGYEKQFFSTEFLAVMQEMFRKEVRNYMSGIDQNGLCG
jgi:hypothetical protein